MRVSPTAARSLHVLVALPALVGVLMELVVALTSGAGPAPTHAERIVRLFSYFTIESNLLIGVTSVMLAVRPDRDGPVFRVARLDALLCIAVTGIVYNTVLSGLQTLTGAGAVSNVLLHTAAPVLAMVVWVLAGPRPRITWATVGWSVAYPVAWLIYTFVRGAATSWFPYPFLDAGEIGWGPALTGAGVVALVFLALGSGLCWLDRRLPAAHARPDDRWRTTLS